MAASTSISDICCGKYALMISISPRSLSPLRAASLVVDLRRFLTLLDHFLQQRKQLLLR
jgi:hypothetical protein